MSGRPRVLPSWMTRKEEKEKETMKSQKKQKTSRAAFYCMNERELVEAAVSFLTTAASDDAGLRTDHRMAVDTTMKMKENPLTTKIVVDPGGEEESSDFSCPQETIFVSESDLDITELGTVPYATSPPPQVNEIQGPGPVEDHHSLKKAEVEAKKEGVQSEKAAEQDDTLQLVRDIFFT